MSRSQPSRPRSLRTLLSAAASVLLISVLGAGCASTGQAESAFDEEREDEIHISIDNRNFADATVWAIIESGTRRRLGTVRGKNESVFTLPFDFPSNLRLEFDLVAGSRCTTRQIPVDPGDLLQLQIAPVLQDTPACR